MPKIMSTSGNTDRHLAISFVAFGIIIFAISGWAWWSRLYTNPDHVFWAMMDASLSTNSVVRHIEQTTEGQAINRYTRLNLGSQNATQVSEIRKQSDGGVSSEVHQETIGTQDADYLRFPYVATTLTNPDGKPVDYSSIEGIWGKTPTPPAGQPPQVQNFQQAVLGTMPFGNLSRADRKILIDYMKNKRVYTVETNKALKKTEHGKTVYAYDVRVNLQAYFSMLQQFAVMLGLGQVNGLDPTQYKGAPPISTQFTVATASHQLLKIRYLDSNQDETYDSYGVTTPVSLPAKTVPLPELERRIQSL